ncbi:UNVERIFIED_ORG: hypothetical protein BCL66_107144 [Martelella mediterranea]
MNSSDECVLTFVRRDEPDARLVAMAGALSSLARHEGVQVAKALQAGRHTRLDLCRITGLSVFQVASATASLVNHGLVSAWRRDAETVYELVHPRLGDVIHLAEELAGPQPLQVVS